MSVHEVAGPQSINQASKKAELIEQIDKFRNDMAEGARLEIKGIDAKSWSLVGVNLSDCDIVGGDWSEADLTRAKAQGTQFKGVILQQTIFDFAELEGAVFDKNCVMFKASFKSVEASHANFFGNLKSATFEAADLQDANFKDAVLYDTIFDRADLQRVKDFKPNHTRIRGTLFSANAPDPWSKLRRTYTGLRLALNLAAFGLFIAALAAKAYGLYGIALIQASTTEGLAERLAEAGLATDILKAECELPGTPCRHVRIIEVLMGFTQSPIATLYVVLAILVNGLRFLLTFSVAQMREEEERSGFSPHQKIDISSANNLFTKAVACIKQLGHVYGWAMPLDQVLSIGQIFVLLLFVLGVIDLALTPLILLGA